MEAAGSSEALELSFRLHCYILIFMFEIGVTQNIFNRIVASIPTNTKLLINEVEAECSGREL
jgi:hypothetical protein